MMNDLYESSIDDIPVVKEEDERSEDEKNDLMRIYVGKKRYYYMPAFEKVKRRPLKNSWNWAAFLGIGIWMAYRKMYLLCVIYYILNDVLGRIEDAVRLWESQSVSVLDPGRVTIFQCTYWVVVAIQIFMNFALGIYANLLYMKRNERLIAKEAGMSEEERTVWRHKKAGVSKKSAWIYLVILLGLSVLDLYVLS